MKKHIHQSGLLLLLLCLFLTTFVSCTGGGTGSGTTGGTPTTLPPTTGTTTATPTQPPAQIIDATIAQVLAGALDQDYRVTGTVAAVSPTTFLLTDEYGNYLYIYAEVEHELAVGDQARVVGTKVAYANIVELKSVQSIERLSKGTIEHPTPVEADKLFFEGQLASFTQGAYVTFIAPITISGNYLNVSFEGLDGAIISLVHGGGAIQDGETYEITGYLIYITGSNTKYINLITTDIRSFDHPYPELCPICNKDISEGNHAECPDCDGYFCDGNDHSHTPTIENCPHCGGDSTVGNHEICPICYLPYCDGNDHTHIVENCPVCGGDLSMGSHEEMPCGHRACEGGEHYPCPNCQGYLCQGSHETLACGHTACQSGNHQPCATCNGYLCQGAHDPRPCGHLHCQEGFHYACNVCGNYLCYGDHTEMSCGHRQCATGEHGECPTCEGYLCDGASHDILECGHRVCDSGPHGLCPSCKGGMLCEGGHEFRECGHRACEDGYHHQCTGCGGYVCDGNDHIHIPADVCPCCGGSLVNEGTHECPHCDGYFCDGNDHNHLPTVETCPGCGEEGITHSKYTCDHYVCEEGSHGACTSCGQFLCQSDGEHGLRPCGDHRYCEAVDIAHEWCETCDSGYICDGGHTEQECGHYACEPGDHDRLSCGHFVCHGGDHGLCEYCHTSRCVGDHHELECHLHHACQGEYPDHSSLGCGHYACEPGDHERCEYCGSYFCQTQYQDHSQRPCGHGYCEPDEHDICPMCQNYRCQGDHRELACGHLACESANHTLCEKCQGYLCVEGHFEMDCGHCSFQSGDHTPCSICGVFLCDPAHRDPCTTDTSILRFLNGALEVEHTVEGYVAAIGLDTILLTDASGNYAHIYCYAEGLSIGQEIGVVGTKYMDFGMPVLASVTDAYHISDGIAYEHPQPQIADVAYLQSMTESFAEVEYIRFTGRLNSDWGGFEFIVEDLENASVLIVYENAMLDDLTHGATYVVTGYALHVSEEENGYRLINMISTSVLSIAICDYCGEVIINEADHGICYTCWNHLCVGDHSLLPCNHLACNYGDHSPCEVCDGYLCLGEHYELYCGHKACEEGNHEYCYECGGYYCDGLDHNHMQELKVYTNKIDASFKTDFDGFTEEYNQNRIFSAQVNGGIKLWFELVEGYESNYNFVGWYIAVDGVPTELIHDMPQFVYNAEFGYEIIAVFEEKQNENSTVTVSISTPDLTFTVDGAPYSMENHYQDTLQKDTYLPMIAPEEGVGVVFVGWFVFNGNIEDPAELADLDNYGDCLTSERGYAHRVGENIQIVALYAAPRFTERCPACREKNIIHPFCPECNIRTCRCICDKIITYPQYETTYVATGDDVVEIGTWEIVDGEILFYPVQEKPVEWKYEICIGEGNTFTATYYLREDATQEFSMSITWTGYFDEEGNFYTESYRHHELFEAMKESSAWYTWEDIRTEPAQYIFFADGTLCGPDGGRPVYVPAYIWAILMSH